MARTQLSLNTIISDVAKLGNLDLSKTDFSTDFGLSDILGSLRNTLINHINEYGASYKDDWNASFNLLGLTAGILATNTKGLSASIRVLTYIYAASHLKSYQDRFKLIGPKIGSQINFPWDKENLIELKITVNQNFEPYYDACDSFASDHVYIGVFGPINEMKADDLKVFSRIPWSAVIDFDPDTENPNHLLGSVKEHLNLRRFVHVLLPNEKIISINSERACYWFAARGLSEHGNSSQLNLTWNYWNRQQSRSLEEFCEKLANSTLKLITVLVFWNDSDDFVDDVIKMIARYFYERTNLIIAHENVLNKKSIIDRFEMKGFNLDLQTIIDGIRSKLPAIKDSSDDIILPVFDGLGKRIEYHSLPLDIYNWLEEDCEVIHFNLGVIQKEMEDENSSFLRGRRINWFELNLHIDIDRDLTHELLSALEVSLSKRERTTVKLIHNPGAGGTTIACRVAWDLHWTYPVLVLRRFSPTTVDRIRDVYTRTQQPVLVVIDSSFVSVTISQTNNLYEKILAQRIPSVFLIVVRDFVLPVKSDRSFLLSQHLSNQEAFRFASILGKEVPAKHKELEKLLISQKNNNQRTPFIFGLTAYEEKFNGLENFVDTRLRGITERESTIIVIISLVDYFSNQSVFAQVFSFYLGLSPTKLVNLRDYLDKYRLDLLIPDETGWRPLHWLVAGEILKQLLANKKEPEQWVGMLTDYAIKIIDLLSETSFKTGSGLNQIISILLRGLFIDRQDAESENQSFGAFEARFSNYIEAIPSIEGKRLVFDKLVEEFEDEPHFWGHRSRLIWYYAKVASDFEDAVVSVDKAISLSVENDPALYHIKGMALAKWSTYLMENVKRELEFLTSEVLNEKLQNIENLVSDALDVFKHIREDLRMNEERAYVSPIELITRYIEFGKAISPSISFAEFLKSPSGRKYSEYLLEAENLLRQVRRVKVGSLVDSKFVREREVFLGKIYDNYSLLISGLRELLDRNDVYRPRYRRSLAYAYLAQSGRDWDKVDQHDLKRILDLMEENMLADPQENSHNIRLWFEAARRLSYTGLDYAIQKLTQWVSIASRVDILDAYYYLYALQAIAAIEGAEMASIQSERSLKMAKQLSQDRPNRTASLDWVGKSKGIGRLISRGRLGKFQEDTSFFGSQDISLLAPLYGRIYRIQTGQSGIIKAYGLEFFFTPSPRVGPHQFVRERDDNLQVTFFGSFSYDGPRAYFVKPA